MEVLIVKFISDFQTSTATAKRSLLLTRQRIFNKRQNEYIALELLHNY